jgi:hypothetical protein
MLTEGCEPVVKKKGPTGCRDLNMTGWYRRSGFDGGAPAHGFAFGAVRRSSPSSPRSSAFGWRRKAIFVLVDLCSALYRDLDVGAPLYLLLIIVHVRAGLFICWAFCCCSGWR